MIDFSKLKFSNKFSYIWGVGKNQIIVFENLRYPKYSKYIFYDELNNFIKCDLATYRASRIFVERLKIDF